MKIVFKNRKSLAKLSILSFLIVFSIVFLSQFILKAYADPGPTDISACANLTTSGETYLLTQNIDAGDTNSSCINTIKDTYISSSPDYGLSLSYSDNNTIENVTIFSCNHGLYLSYSDYNSFYLLNSSSNNFNGAYVDHVEYTNFTNCTMSNNGANGFHNPSNFNNGTIENCTFKSNVVGLYIDEVSDTTIKNNVIQDNSQYGIRDIFVGLNAKSHIYNNLLNNTDNYNQDIEGYANDWNTTKQSGSRIYSSGIEIGGNYWTNSTGNDYSDTCTDSNSDGFCDSPYDVEDNNTCTPGVDCSDNTDFLPLSDEYSESQCGEISSDYTLNKNVSADATCFNITADDVILDCAGYYVNYSAVSLGHGVNAINRDNITIKNCNFFEEGSNNAYAIYFDDVNNSLIYNNVLLNGSYSGFKIDGESYFLNISWNTINASNEYVALFTGSAAGGPGGNSTIEHNILWSLSSSGAAVFNSFNNLTNNSIRGYGSYGLNLEDVSDYNRLIDNKVYAEFSYALDMLGDNCYFEGNYFEADESAVFFNGADYLESVNDEYVSTNDVVLLVAAEHMYFTNITVNSTQTGDNIKSGIALVANHYNNTFVNSTIQSLSHDAIDIASGVYDTYFINSTILSNETDYDFDYASGAKNITLLDTSFNSSKLNFADTGDLFVKWYMRANVTNSTGNAISDASVNVYQNSTESWILDFSDTSDANGLTRYDGGTENRTNGTANYPANLNITASKAGYDTNSTISSIDQSENYKTVQIILTETSPDSQNPTYDNDEDNSSAYGSYVPSGSPVKIYVNWTDDIELSKAVFRHNASGVWANESWHDFSGNPEWYNTTYTTQTGDIGKTICWNQWANDTSNNWNDTMADDAHCFEVSDPTPPQWSNNATKYTSPVEYKPEDNHGFQVEWIDSDSDVDNAIFEWDGTNNYTMSNTSSTFYYNITGLAVGTYSWKSYTNNTYGYENSTDTWSYEVTQNTSGTVDLFLNGTQGQFNMSQNEYLNTTAVLSGVDETQIEIWTNYSDGTWKLWDSGNSPLENITQLTVAGIFNFTANFTNANYTSAYESWIANVTAIIPSECNVYINASSELPYTINQNDSYYCLNDSSIDHAGNGISFATGTNNVTLDCKGYNIDISGAYEGITIFSSTVNNITIKNCSITGHRWGIQLGGDPHNITIRDNTISSGTSGITIFSNAYDITFINNTIKDNSGYGIFSDYGRNNTFTDNYVYNNAINFAFDTGSENNLVTGGSIHGGTNIDYDFQGSSGKTNAFRNTNFTANRTIRISTSINGFPYSNDTSNGIWLNTTWATGDKVIRDLLNWNQTMLKWTDNSSGSLTASYNISGLIDGEIYYIYKDSVYQEPKTATDGKIYLEIYLSSFHEIQVRNSTLTPDTTKPQYSDNSTNTTVAGTPTEHRLKWTDNIALNRYILSFDNCTGSFNNITEGSLSGTEDWSNVTVVINSTIDCTIRWKVYANDTSNNWNTSDTYSYNTTEEPTPVISSVQATGITTSAASITWTTDIVANSSLVISPSATYSNNASLATSHSIDLTGLSASITYNYNVTSCTATEKCNTSTGHQFTTSAAGDSGGGNGGGCTEDWNCSYWSDCYPNNTQYRNCTDKNNCGTTTDKPITVQNCTYYSAPTFPVINITNITYPTFPFVLPNGTTVYYPTRFAAVVSSLLAGNFQGVILNIVYSMTDYYYRPKLDYGPLNVMFMHITIFIGLYAVLGLFIRWIKLLKKFSASFKALIYFIILPLLCLLISLFLPTV